MRGGYVFAIDGDGEGRPEGGLAGGILFEVIEQYPHCRAVRQGEFAGLFRNKVFEDAEDKETHTHAF